MGLMDNLRKLTQPYGDDDDFFEGADSSFRPQETAEPSEDQLQFEAAFGGEPAAAPEPAKKAPKLSSPASGGLFGSREPRQEKAARPQKPARGRNAGYAVDQSVVRFNPKDFDEAGELVGYLEQGRSLIMSLEELPSETARRLLDFMSGIAFALNGKINPVSAKTYFVTPENVDLLDAQPSSGSSSGDFE